MFVEFSLHFPKPVFELIKNPIMIPFLFEEKKKEALFLGAYYTHSIHTWWLWAYLL